MPNNNPTGKGGFTKGDPRINRKGRPKHFKAFRELAVAIAHEPAVAKGDKIVINGKVVTVTEMILRQWAQSKNPQLQKAFIEIAYGKVPDRTELTGADGGPIETKNDVTGIDEGIAEIVALLDKARERASPGDPETDHK